MVWWDELQRRALTLARWHLACAYNIGYMRVSVGHPRGGITYLRGVVFFLRGVSRGSRAQGGCGGELRGLLSRREGGGEACRALSAYIAPASWGEAHAVGAVL